MGRAIFTTIGFEPGLVMKSLVRIGLREDDKIVLIYTLSGDKYSREKVSDALRTVQEFLKTVGIEIIDHEISGTNFYDDVKKIVKVLVQYKDREIIASLVGGMRMIILATLYALEIFSRLNKTRAKIHVMREDGLYEIFLLTPLVPNIGRGEMNILRLLKEHDLNNKKRSEVVKKLVEMTGLTQFSIRKTLYNIEKKNLIKIDDGYIKITKLGELFLGE
jgi:CRISPR locus-related DNA-binding protein